MAFPVVLLHAMLNDCTVLILATDGSTSAELVRAKGVFAQIPFRSLKRLFTKSSKLASLQRTLGRYFVLKTRLLGSNIRFAAVPLH